MSDVYNTGLSSILREALSSSRYRTHLFRKYFVPVMYHHSSAGISLL
jgi:hypothetical protein